MQFKNKFEKYTKKELWWNFFPEDFQILQNTFLPSRTPAEDSFSF